MRDQRATFWIFAQVLTALSMVGCVLVVVRLGGLTAAASVLLLHSRGEGVGETGIGGGLWTLFALPAMTALLVSAYCKIYRRIALVELALLTAAAVGLFGSRLLIILALAAAWFAWFSLTKSILSGRAVAAAIVGVAVMSSFVLGTRTAAQGQVDRDTALREFSYAIFDVTVASYAIRDDLGPGLAAASRAWTTLSTAIPGSRNRADEISASRVDVQIVRRIGTAAQAESSGLPPSLPGYAVVAFGTGSASALAAILGLILGCVGTVLTRWRGALGAFAYGLWGAFVFNAFKGGDLTLDLGSEIRLVVYLTVIWLGVKLAVRGGSWG